MQRTTSVWPVEFGGDQVKMTIKAIAPAPKALIFPDAEA